MPFGKHRGEEIEKIPTDYLLWLIGHVTFREAELEEAVLEEYEARTAAEHRARESARQREAEQAREAERARREREEAFRREQDRERQQWSRGSGAGRSPGALPGNLRAWALEMVKCGYREMAKRHHPDLGGRTRDMQEINAAQDALRKLIGE